jgi:hypothetical protein
MSKGKIVPENRATLLKTIRHNLLDWVRQPVRLSFFVSNKTFNLNLCKILD